MSDLEDLKRRVELLERRKADLEHCERRIINDARQYARLVHLGYAIDDKGYRIQYSPEDLRDLAEYYLQSVKREALGLLRAETSGS